jgi:hypothetical protein
MSPQPVAESTPLLQPAFHAERGCHHGVLYDTIDYAVPGDRILVADGAL